MRNCCDHMYKARILCIAPRHLWKHMPRGGEISTRIILNYLKNKGFEIHVVCNSRGFPEDKGEVNGIKYWSKSYNHLKDFCEKQIKTFNYDVLMSWSLEGVITQQLSKKFNIPYIYFVRSLHMMNNPPLIDILHKKIDQAIIKKYQNVFNDAEVIFSNSNFTRKVVKRYYNRDSIVSYPPVKIKCNRLSTNRLDKREYLTLIGWMPSKGSEIVEALSRKLPDQKFLGVGGNKPIDKKNLKIIPYTYHIDRVFSKTRILLCPSIYDETFGRVALEALGRGIPVIASRCGGLPEVVGDKRLLISRKKNLNHWIKKINDVLNDYPAFSKSAFTQSKKFDWKIEVQKIEKAIYSIIS